MSQDSKTTVFTPLRITLMTAIVLANGMALVSQLAAGQPWAHPLGIFAVVFIMLFVFVILLEVVWLHHRAKPITDPQLKGRYKQAKWLYLMLFFLGFVMVAWLLL